ncbi:MAG TPA: translocation/assembly module TamB domain-containing protein [Bryobacteraceae bacterium]|nr:translocation/assembly module TamB domain-containing protein [Bryobacteraceae bacterium]
MTRGWRITRNIAIAVAALVVVAVVAVILTVRTVWFQSYVKEKIISATEDSTGGRVEVGTFQFDWQHLRAVVTGFVIHGTEPAGAAPLFRAPRMELDMRLFTSIHHLLDLSYLGIERPEANIVVLPDGRSNLPTPKQASSPNEPPLQPVVNAAIDHFALTNGTISFASGKQRLDVRGNNLQAQLWYNVLQQGYNGQLSFQPLDVVSDHNSPVNFTVALPVSIKSNRVDFQNATISTPASTIHLSGSVQDLRNPTISAHINGDIALADLKNAANLPLSIDTRNGRSTVQVDANAIASNSSIQVNGLRMTLGHSDFEASGKLKDPHGNGSLAFRSTLALGELGRLAKLAERPAGTVQLNGTAKLDANNNYELNGNVNAKNVSFREGSQQVNNIDLISAVHLDPHHLDLNGLRLAAFGGDLTGNLSMVDFARFQFRGDLHNLDLRTAARTAGEKQFPYDGVLSGPLEAQGDLKAKPEIRSMAAHARLSIAPGRQGVPVSGRLYAGYNGASDNLTVDNSYIALPHTRLSFNGSVGKQLNLSLTTTDLNDLLVATSMNGKVPVNLNGHPATFSGTVTGRLTSPRVAGHLQASMFSVEGREFNSLNLDAAVSRTGASVQNGLVTRGSMQGQFSAQVGLNNWAPTPQEPVAARAEIRNGDLADLVALAGQPSTNYSGALTANVQVNGTVGNPTGSAELAVTNGALYGEPFDRIQARVNLADQLVTIPAATLEAGSARVNLTAEYQHPRDSFTTGQLHAHVQSNAVDLAQLRALQKQRPNTGGTLQVNMDAGGKVAPSQFLLTSLNGDFSARGLHFEGQTYGDLSATARTSGQTVQYQLTSDFAGSNVRVAGNTQLTPEYPTTADANIRNLPIERVLAVARRTDISAKGNLSGTAHFSGTKDNPQGNVDVQLANAVIYDEPLTGVRLKAAYLPRSVTIEQAEVASAAGRIDLSGRFDHAEGNFQAGTVQFQVTSNGIDIARVHNLQERRPGLGGQLQLTASGSAEVRGAEPRVQVRDLNASVAANRIAVQGKNYGDLSLKATSQSGNVNFTLASDLAGSSIQGHGTAQLVDHYPVDAQLTFNNVAWSRLQGLIGEDLGGEARFEMLTDGQIAVRGPVMNLDDLRSSVELSRLEVSSIPTSPAMKPVTIRNQGPITAALDKQTVRVTSAHLTGPQTDIQVSGTASLKDRSMDLQVNANANLGLLENFDRDIASSGEIVVATTVRGTVSSPLMNGRVTIQNASFNYTGISNGISNANGVVLLTGNSATFQNVTAESGGGKLTLGGFVVMGGNPRFGLRANATTVRIEVQQGVSVTVNGDIRLAGVGDSSQVSGTATIMRVAYAPQTDLGSVLTRAAPPVQAATAPSPLLDNMKLDIRVLTSDALLVQASLAQSVQGQADLRIRGTASHPGVLGRVSITEGTLVFFGSNYTVNTGTIAFYNPVRIEPVLDVSLQTQAQGVTVTLRVTGPVDNLKLSYTSDPPLQFQEIVRLLAAGQTPTSDPTILANQPSQPAQTFQQMGESAVLSRAVADPVATRLQRVFGVSQLKISPTFTSGSQLPEAQVSLQQRVANNITFTYVSSLNNANAQTISVEVTLNPQWSAVALRDQNGIFSINLFYKRQFR